MAVEQWKVAPLSPKFPKVEVSSLGRVRYQHGLPIRAVLRGSRPSNPKYWSVQLRFGPGDNNRSWWRVHDLVLMTFAGPRPPQMMARYKNGDLMDLSVENLEWGPTRRGAHPPTP